MSYRNLIAWCCLRVFAQVPAVNLGLLTAQSSHPRKCPLCRCRCYNASLFNSQHFQNCVWGNKFFPHSFVMCCWMMFCPVIGIIQLTWSPIYSELFLTFPVSQPMESYVHCFGAFWLNFTIYSKTILMYTASLAMI